MVEIVAITTRQRARECVSKNNGTHMLSTVDKGKRTFRHPTIPGHQHLEMYFDDDEDPTLYGAPTRQQVESILEWAASLPPDARLVVNCEAGVSRSTACALSILAQQGGPGSAESAMQAVLALRPQAAPNLLIAAYADIFLGLDGELHAVAERVTQDKMLNVYNLTPRLEPTRKIIEAARTAKLGP
jgi:predicted protein tyrosine phosphatase